MNKIINGLTDTLILGGSTSIAAYLLKNPITCREAAIFGACQEILSKVIFMPAVDYLNRENFINKDLNTRGIVAVTAAIADLFFSQKLLSAFGVTMGFGTTLSLWAGGMAIGISVYNAKNAILANTQAQAAKKPQAARSST